ncbi:MAG: hypothetical protein HEEMFOPI_01401 [Holosporales bacterium]
MLLKNNKGEKDMGPYKTVFFLILFLSKILFCVDIGLDDLEEPENHHISSQNFGEYITRNSTYSDATSESHSIDLIGLAETIKEFRESQLTSTDTEMKTLQNDKNSKLSGFFLHPDETPTDPLQNDLQIKSDTLLEKLHNIETSLWRRTFRWVSLDTFLQRIGYFLILRSGDIKFKDEKKRCCSQPIWLSGGSFPINSNSARQRVLFVNDLCQGAQFIIFRTLHTGLTALTLYQLYNYIYQKPSLQCHNPTDEKNVEDLWKFWRNSDDRVLLGVFHDVLGAQNTDLSYLKYLLLTPLVWGIGKGLWNTRESSLSHEDISKTLEEMDLLTPSIGRDFFRWLLPLHPINRKMGTLMKNVLWNPNVSSENLQTIWKRLQILIIDHQGYTSLYALFHVMTLVHSLNDKDVEMFRSTLLKKENIDEKTELLSSSKLDQTIFQEEDMLEYMLCGTVDDRTFIKHQAFKFLEDISYFKRVSEEKTIIKKIQRGIIVIYANYLFWSLGASKSLIEIIVPTLFKGGKLYVQIKLIQTLVHAFLEAQKCPKQPGVSIMGVEPWANDLTQACFEANVQAFNIIPGQPVDTLVGGLNKYYFPVCSIDLDLSNKGLNGETIANITRALLNRNITLRSINLSGNMITDDINNFFGNFDDLRSLDLSNNNIGNSGKSVIALAELLGNLTKLTYLNLSKNRIGKNTEKVLTVFFKALGGLTNLIQFDISDNEIGDFIYNDAIITFGESLKKMTHLNKLILARNSIGLNINSGIFVILQSLGMLTNLTFLDLSGMYVAFNGENGTVALSQSLKNLTNLIYFDLSGENFIGSDSDYGTIILGQSLKNLVKLKHLDLSGNLIGYLSDEGTNVIGQALENLTNLMFLNISWNYMGYNSEESILSIAKSLSILKNLNLFCLLPCRYNFKNKNIIIINQALNHTLSPQIKTYLYTIKDVEIFCQNLSPSIENIDLTANMFQPDVLTMTFLMNCLASLKYLTILNLSKNMIGFQDDKVTMAFGHLLKNLTKLKTLNISDNYMGLRYGEDGIIDLCESLAYLKNMTVFDAAKNYIGYQSYQSSIVFGQSLGNLTQLRYLDLSRNWIGYHSDEGTIVVGQSLGNLTQLRYLDLLRNWIGYTGNKGILAISDSLRSLNKLKQLDFSQNWLGSNIRGNETGMMNFCQSFRGLFSLNNLNLAGNMIEYSWNNGTIVLGEALGNLTNLTQLNLAGNNIGGTGETGVIALAYGLMNLKSLRLLDLGCGYFPTFQCNLIGLRGSNGPTAILLALADLPNISFKDLNIQGMTNIN